MADEELLNEPKQAEEHNAEQTHAQLKDQYIKTCITLSRIETGNDGEVAQYGEMADQVSSEELKNLLAQQKINLAREEEQRDRVKEWWADLTLQAQGGEWDNHLNAADELGNNDLREQIKKMEQPRLQQAAAAQETASPVTEEKKVAQQEQRVAERELEIDEYVRLYRESHPDTPIIEDELRGRAANLGAGLGNSITRLEDQIATQNHVQQNEPPAQAVVAPEERAEQEPVAQQPTAAAQGLVEQPLPPEQRELTALAAALFNTITATAPDVRMNVHQREGGGTIISFERARVTAQEVGRAAANQHQGQQIA